MTSNEKALLVKGKAGMGNRILTLLDCILYTQLTNRQLLIDWTDYTYSDDHSNVFQKFFVESAIPNYREFHGDDLHNYSSIFPLEWKGRLDKSVNSLAGFLGLSPSKLHERWPSLKVLLSTDLEKLDYREDLVVRWAYATETQKLRNFFDGDHSLYSKMNNEEILSFLIKKYLVLGKQVQDRIAEARPSFPSSKVIGVHVRFTDFKTDLKKYSKVINKLLKKDAEASIYLATDNREVEKFFRSIYGEKIYVVDKWYPEDGSPIHQNPSCPSRFESGIQALIDIYLLASCDDLVCDLNSTFAYVAKLLHDDSKGRVINISFYFYMKKFIRNILN